MAEMKVHTGEFNISDLKNMLINSFKKRSFALPEQEHYDIIAEQAGKFLADVWRAANKSTEQYIPARIVADRLDALMRHYDPEIDNTDPNAIWQHIQKNYALIIER